jgi:hypothetical protein
MKLLAKIKAPFWVALNLLKACWFRELIYMAERKKQNPTKRKLLLALIYVEIVLTYAAYFVCAIVIGHLAIWVLASVLAVHAASVEIRRAYSSD